MLLWTPQIGWNGYKYYSYIVLPPSTLTSDSFHYLDDTVTCAYSQSRCNACMDIFNDMACRAELSMWLDNSRLIDVSLLVFGDMKAGSFLLLPKHVRDFWTGGLNQCRKLEVKSEDYFNPVHIKITNAVMPTSQWNSLGLKLTHWWEHWISLSLNEWKCIWT